MTLELQDECAKWRKELEKSRRCGEALEAFARQLGLTEFSVYPDSYSPRISWAKFGGTLQEFSARVKVVAKKLGRAPDSCDASHMGFQFSADEKPDLQAEWNFPSQIIEGHDVTVIVRSMMPMDCKLDPSTNYVEKQEQSIHPECKAVLASLEDL